jgi:KUP system potassium uptake protein
MIIWFTVIAMLGIHAIAGKPEILMAVNPQFALRFFLQNGLQGFSLLGAVVLCITGCDFCVT